MWKEISLSHRTVCKTIAMRLRVQHLGDFGAVAFLQVVKG